VKAFKRRDRLRINWLAIPTGLWLGNEGDVPEPRWGSRLLCIGYPGLSRGNGERDNHGLYSTTPLGLGWAESRNPVGILIAASGGALCFRLLGILKKMGTFNHTERLRQETVNMIRIIETLAKITRAKWGKLMGIVRK
jgi:hypothetical protein